MISDSAYARILQSELEKRKSRNPAFSMRAFARTLGVHASSLSMMLRAKTAPSLEIADEIWDALKSFASDQWFQKRKLE